MCEDSKIRKIADCAHLRCDWLLLQVLEYPESDTLAFSTDTSSILRSSQNTILEKKIKYVWKSSLSHHALASSPRFISPFVLANSIIGLTRKVDGEDSIRQCFARVGGRVWRSPVSMRELTRRQLDPRRDKSAARSETRERAATRAHVPPWQSIEVVDWPSFYSRYHDGDRRDRNRAARFVDIDPSLDLSYLQILGGGGRIWIFDQL